MRSFLQRISSRKFLAALAVEVAALAALFWPEHESAISEAATRIAALAAMLAAALGYAKIEANLDAEQSRAVNPNGPPEAAGATN